MALQLFYSGKVYVVYLVRFRWQTGRFHSFHCRVQDDDFMECFMAHQMRYLTWDTICISGIYWRTDLLYRSILK